MGRSVAFFLVSNPHWRTGALMCQLGYDTALKKRGMSADIGSAGNA